MPANYKKNKKTRKTTKSAAKFQARNTLGRQSTPPKHSTNRSIYSKATQYHSAFCRARITSDSNTITGQAIIKSNWNIRIDKIIDLV